MLQIRKRVMDMLRDLLLFLIIIAGGSYGLWLMRGLDGLVRRKREESR